MIGGDILGERARLTPDAEALVVRGSVSETADLRLTYRELDARAGRCARVWRGLGLGHGDRVCVLSHNRVEMLDAFFAAGKTGTIVVPLGTRLTAHELAPIVDDAGAGVFFYDGAFEEIVGILREECEGVEHWISFDGPSEVSSATKTYDELLARLDPEEDFEPASCDAEDVYCLLYTSGTTGAPKGVMIPHRMVAWNGYNTVCCWQLRADDVSPIFTPLYHAGGLMAFLVPMVTIGGKIVLHRAFDPEEVWRTVEDEGCTVILGVPTIWQMLLESPAFAAADLSSVRWLISGGAPLPAWIAEAYRSRGIGFKQGFGMTEVGVNCFAMTLEDSRTRRGSIGKPMMHTEVKLVDEDGDEVGADEVGEMLFRGPHVSLGYWNRPEETAAAYDDDGFFHSGDLARRDADGYFYVAGREKDVIISGGVNIYPAEVEAAMLRHPGVRDAALVGIEHEKWGEVGVAFVVPLEDDPGGESLDGEELSSFLGERLARYKLPKETILLEALPRTDYGKVRKPALRELYLEEHSSE